MEKPTSDHYLWQDLEDPLSTNNEIDRSQIIQIEADPVVVGRDSKGWKILGDAEVYRVTIQFNTRDEYLAFLAGQPVKFVDGWSDSKPKEV